MAKKSLKANAALNILKELMVILFPMITFQYVCKTLGTEGYGIYTFSNSIVNYISYIAAAGILRYAIRECAAVRDDKKRCQELVNEIYSINVITTVAAFLILLFLILFWPKLHFYAPVIIVLSLTVVFTTVGVDWINTAFEDYLYITIRYIICQSIALVLVFVLVKTSEDVVWYAVVIAFGVVMPNIINRVHIKKRFGISPKIVINNNLKKHIKAIAFLFACTIATFIYINSDVTVLGIFFSDDITGYYGASSKFYLLVKQVINAAFVVLIPRISNEMAKGTQKTTKQLNKVLHLTILISVPASVGLVMIRKNLILFFSGEEFIRSQSSLFILALAVVPAMLANFFINIVMIPMKLEKKVMGATIVSAAVNLVLNIVLIPKYAENAAAITTLIAEIILCILGWYYCRSIKFSGMIKPVLVSLLGAVSIFVICYFMNKYIDNSLLGLLIPVIVSCFWYFCILAVSYRRDISDILKRRERH